MSSIEAQLKLEEQMVQRGIEAYRKAKEAALDGGRGSETGFARRLMDEYIQPLTEALEAAIVPRKGPGYAARAHVHLRGIASDKAIFLTLRCIFNAFQNSRQGKEATPVSISNVCGRLVEDEIRFSRFQQQFKAYYQEIASDFKRKGSKDYRYMHRVLTHSANSHEDGWKPWSVSERVDVGMRLLDLVLQHTDLIEKGEYNRNGQTVIVIRPTDATLDFINRYDEVAELVHPRQMPCIIKPDDWTSIDQGGYYSPTLRSACHLVLTRHPKQKKILRRADLSNVMQAVNGAQSVEWKVNKKVLEVLKLVWAKNLQVGVPSSEKLVPSECPIKDKKKEEMTDAEVLVFMEWKRQASEVYTREKERIGKCFQITSILRAANEYSTYDKFWYVWQLDFRGRLYTATSGFSPQGPDVAKGLLTFAGGKPLGSRGVYWLKVHLANRYGFDKGHYDERVQWVDQRHNAFIAAAADPIAHIDVWKDADKPYQFLAALFEYKEMHDGRLVGKRPEEYVSYLPIGLDGSCNGLQHFSAMLRDPVGGAATNLVGAERPNDIYAQVAAVCLEKVRKESLTPDSAVRAVATEWVSFTAKYGDGKMPRKVAKRPVMTMPYGSTRQSCTQYIFEAVNELGPTHFTSLSSFLASSALTPFLWNSIGEVVVAARKGMDWLQKCAGVMSKQGLGITWRTRDGFVVYMFEREMEVVRIDTVLGGRYQARVGNYTETLDKNGQRNGVAPNFVHSQDGAHLRATILKAQEAGIASLALIHDDYGTHAADTDTLHRIIRESFVEQYTEFDPLVSFKDWQEMIGKEKLPELPKYGDLDITEVLKSPFFFG
ncbi:DNA-directed RNA polymerase protein [Rhizobium phage RHph_N37]|uniref:DNA-directed RNA polymerase n=1 Tax=Rhizobium phage RHph_N37 TaxID=2509749 RepID=A0A7S5RE81_9CAUD|nr:DNA-directed RNA polymerase protein [Rhizobium phage RHph_N37]